MIGLNVDITSIKGNCYKIQGIIIDETRNTFLIKDVKDNNIKRIPKKSVMIIAKLDDGSIVKIDGNLIIGRPEERIKKKYKIFFKF